MAKFKTGDEVICVEPWPNILEKGKVYKVTSVQFDYYTYFIKVNSNDTFWNEKRFVHNVVLS